MHFCCVGDIKSISDSKMTKQIQKVTKETEMSTYEDNKVMRDEMFSKTEVTPSDRTKE